MKDIVIFGAGGFGREIACLIRLINQQAEPLWNIIGFLDDNPQLKGTANEYGPVLGGVDWLNDYDKPIAAAIAVGDPKALESIVNRIVNPQVEFPNLFAPSVIFLDMENLQLGKGNIFCTNCMVSCHVSIGDFNIFNGGIPVGHDVEMGSFNVVMPSCNISGGVKMGDRNFLGVQSVVLQNVKMGCDTRVGANSVVIRKTKDGYLYIGNPAQRVNSKI